MVANRKLLRCECDFKKSCFSTSSLEARKVYVVCVDFCSEFNIEDYYTAFSVALEIQVHRSKKKYKTSGRCNVKKKKKMVGMMMMMTQVIPPRS